MESTPLINPGELVIDRAKATAATALDEFEWGRRDAVIRGANGEIVFEQRGVEAPTSWSDTAVNVVASKYFRGHVGDADREDSVRDLVARVVGTIARWAIADGYVDGDGAKVFYRDLVRLVVSQSLAFNTPVWLNVGIDDRPQCSACYISSVDDSLDSIMKFAAVEAKIFQRGGGSGANLSRLRSSNELLTNGGTASGPVSFMKGFDTFAGVIKSGGRMRRAAKMVVLNINHPDLRAFVRAKRGEEEKARALVVAGYDGGIDGDVYSGVAFQNSNHSVRVTDEFMARVEADEIWEFLGVTTGCITETIPARDLLREIAESAWACGDPGVQFDDAANRWHTCPSSGRINGSNPCSEYMFLDDSACNLASLNLRKFQGGDGRLDVERFRAAVDVAILAQDVVVDRANYPTEEIGRNARRFRPLGLGYANLGAYLMAAGLPYDSDDGRGIAADITALMTARAYRRSAEIAVTRGAFDGFAENRESVLGVLDRHFNATVDLPMAGRDVVGETARVDFLEARRLAEKTGVRNAQVTVLAPTGTIAFMMDCDTTGIEPDYALVKTKALVGGGTLSSVNGTVRKILLRFFNTEEYVEKLVARLVETGSLGDAFSSERERAVFDCAAVDVDGRSISVDGHLGMMAAVQPFLSGAISKTVNLPKDATVEDVERVFVEAHALGLKAVAVYRDGCKAVQPLEAKKSKKANGKNGNGKGRLAELEVGAVTSTREKLPEEVKTIRQKFEIAGAFDGYVHAGLYPDGRVGEVFIRLAKQGSALFGLVDALATAVSIGLQYGVPLDVFTEKFSHWRFEPSGYSSDPRIGFANSIVDYVFRWLGIRFPGGSDAPPEEVAAAALRGRPTAETEALGSSPDAPFCEKCSTQTRRNGTCFVCPTCGETTGCS